MKGKKIYHLNDRTLKYQILAQSKRLHQYLELPGEFKAHYPQEVVFPNMDSGRMDALYSTDIGLLVNLEEESASIGEKTYEKFGKYAIFVSYMYSKNLYIAVICHKDPKKEIEVYELSPSLRIVIHYYYIPQDALWEKYDNLINKVGQKEELSEIEALDIAFVSKFISPEYAQEVTESLAGLFNEAIIPDRKLRIDVAAILGAMIIKYFSDFEKQKELMEKINMEHYEDEMKKIVYDEFGDELNAKDEVIKAKNQELKSQASEIKSQASEIRSQASEIRSQASEIKSQADKIESLSAEVDKLNQSKMEYEDKIKQLSEFEDLNVPEARKLISLLMLL